ncbi:DUF4142 domain-containing protein [Caulobacter sp. S45]|uniref:DUF4142 domain-containing protein n=1 Tax=Caulobacter sp. S45 TaxID=1641861 RepID=UPI0015765393|nr:DUF4142 domain-containing protein [Caulobacter sp. S45]
MSAASLALAQDAPPPPMTPSAMADMAKSPGAYVTAAGQSDKFEITEGRLAAQMGSSDKVRAFGQKMITDHTKSTMKVMAAAKMSGLPKMPPPALRPDQQDMVAQLKAASGPAFDSLYIQQQMQSHQQALMVQQNYAKHGADMHLKMVAMKTVPVVQEHISMLQNMGSGM